MSIYNNNITDENCGNCQEKLKDCVCGATEGLSFTAIICPYCGQENEPEGAEDFEAGERVRSCSSCPKDFLVDVDVSFSWMTSRPEDKEL